MFNQRRLERLTRQVISMIYGQLNDYKVTLWKLVLEEKQSLVYMCNILAKNKQRRYIALNHGNFKA